MVHGQTSIPFLMIPSENIFVTFSGIIHPMMMNDGVAMASAPGVSIMLRKNDINLPPPVGDSSPQDVKIRKDFPESFIFDDFDETGLVTLQVLLTLIFVCDIKV